MNSASDDGSPEVNLVFGAEEIDTVNEKIQYAKKTTGTLFAVLLF